MSTHQCWQLIICPWIHFSLKRMIVCLFHAGIPVGAGQTEVNMAGVAATPQMCSVNVVRGSPKKVFASLPGMNLVCNLGFYSVYTNGFRQEREEHWGNQVQGGWDPRCGINLTSPLPLPHQASGGQEPCSEQLLHSFDWGLIVRLGPEVSGLIWNYFSVVFLRLYVYVGWDWWRSWEEPTKPVCLCL